jgi:hypothetical protein
MKIAQLCADVTVNIIKGPGSWGRALTQMLEGKQRRAAPGQRRDQT